MIPTTVSVTFKKAVSDGNYGTESAEVHISADVSEGESANGLLAVLLSEARAHVHSELGGSPSIAVRRALQRQDPAPSRQAREASDDEAPF